MLDNGTAIVIVSHDRDLLNKAVGAIIHLSEGKLTWYTGGYDRFEKMRAEKVSSLAWSMAIGAAGA